MLSYFVAYSFRTPLAAALGYPLLIVARAGLGTVNHTLLTLAVAQSLCWEVVLVASGLVAGGFAIATGTRIPLGRSKPENGAPA